MPKRLSAALNIPHQALEDANVFDRFIDLDSRLHVDPHLLATSVSSEMVAAAATLNKFWEDTIVVLRGIFEHGDSLWRAAFNRFIFPENSHAGLGYSQKGTDGAAIGKGTAEALVTTAREIVRAGITDPKIFELVGLLEPGVGPDSISDITIHIVERHLLEFTSRVALELGLPTQPHTVRGETYNLPYSETGSYVLFLPRDILRPLPLAFCWDDVDAVCAYNEALRARVNSLIGENWKAATENVSKQQLKQVLLETPEVLADLLKQYRQKRGQSYDFTKDVLGEEIPLDVVAEYAAKNPLDLECDRPVTAENILAVVRKICDQFRHLVENGGLWYLFWTDQGEVRSERSAQLVFFAVADAYCKANNLDLSPEVNSGRGPVDFKISKGYNSRVLVELKWSKNPKLLHGFKVQIEEYAKSERTHSVIFLVIQVSATRQSINRLEALQGEIIRAGNATPEIKVVDGRIKASASHFDGEL